MSTESQFDQTWQTRLLPLLSKMIIGLTVFFFAVSLAQLTYLHRQISQGPELNVSQAFMPTDTDGIQSEALRMEYVMFRVLAEMEMKAMQSRRHQSSVALMARVWTRYMGFVTGMILALVGALFVLAKLRAGETDLEGGAGDAKVKVRSASPGIILAVLGVALMISTIMINHRIEYSDSALFVRLSQLSSLHENDAGQPVVPTPAELFGSQPSQVEDEEDTQDEPQE